MVNQSSFSPFSGQLKGIEEINETQGHFLDRKLRVFHNNLGMSVRVFLLVDFKIYIMESHQILLVLSYNLVQTSAFPINFG